MNQSGPLSTDPYKGVRDFYPEDMAVQNYIFSIMRGTAESFGFSEYTASILEESELYASKTSEEIANEQTYTFIDRGERSVTLRPEMTPTVTRMVAAKKRELNFPLKWYSIPNLFRYERPQRGRLREHWQLNADIFGAKGLGADAEIILLSYSLMRNFGAKPENFRIEISDRDFLRNLSRDHGADSESFHTLIRLIDKKKKIDPEAFVEGIKEILPHSYEEFLKALEKAEENLPEYVASVLGALKNMGVSNAVFNPYLARGFDYYTGMVFEVFDTSPLNNRSLFGGGRYDDLMKMFGESSVPTVGFGMGDVTIRDFLETHKLMPTLPSVAHVFIATIEPSYIEGAHALGERLRAKGVNAMVNVSDKKVGDQIKRADKEKIPFVITYGEDEAKTQTYPLKNLVNKEEKKIPEADLPESILSAGV